MPLPCGQRNVRMQLADPWGRGRSVEPDRRRLRLSSKEYAERLPVFRPRQKAVPQLVRKGWQSGCSFSNAGLNSSRGKVSQPDWHSGPRA